MKIKDLRDGKKIVGTMVRMIRNSSVTQIALAADLDFIMLDMEHGAYSIETFSDIAKVAKSIELGIFVRVPELSKGYVSRVLDAGADGVMVPMISTREEAQALARWAKYEPIGKRGYGSSCVQTGYGNIDTDTMTFMKNRNKESLAIAQIETKEAINNIDAIAEVEGIDVLLIGPNDLSISLGLPGKVMDKIVQQAIEKVANAAEKNGKIFSMHAGDKLLEKWIPRGMNMIMNELDVSVLKSGFNSIAKKYK